MIRIYAVSLTAAKNGIKYRRTFGNKRPFYGKEK